ncbi:hypothetical protein SDC9_189524 [bioreactor metagenome]|uniref:Uncharacterized protein n=1 Tax=bioreactor metagenome TaxID=1076179 RepID=A0A645HUU9_9ZZZZ
MEIKYSKAIATRRFSAGLRSGVYLVKAQHSKKGSLRHHFDKAEKQLQAVENNDRAADHVDGPQKPVVKFMAEQGDENRQAQEPEAGG